MEEEIVKSIRPIKPPFYDFIYNNKQISNLLAENEDLKYNYKKNNKDDKITIDKHSLIQIPKNIIRSKSNVFFNYDLRDLQLSSTAQDNVSYYLQFQQLIDYIIENINIFGPLEKVVYQYGIINLFSIFECCFMDKVNHYRTICDKCNKQGRGCEKIINNKASKGFSCALTRCKELHLFEFPPEKEMLLKELKRLRNNVHIYMHENPIYLNKKLTLDEYRNKYDFFKKSSRTIKK